MRFLFALVLSGCGTNLAAIADPLYEIARMTCGNAEELVLSREDVDPEIKAARIAEIRAKCDPVFDAFERIAE